MPTIEIQVKGLLELQTRLKAAPREMAQAVKDAAGLVGDTVLNTEGLRKYPPSGPGNRPPLPYYVRGGGTQTAHGNLGNSENLGKRFYSIGAVAGLGSTVVRIGNVASYAPYVVGQDQARAMARIGWRRLYDVAVEKQGRIRNIFEAVIQSALRKLGL